MDEEISIINTKTRNEKIKNFFINNKKYLIVIFSSIILIIFAYFLFGEIQDRKIKSLAEKYNNITINYENSNKINIKNQLVEIIKEKDSTYSPLALYFIIDNEIQTSNKEINQYFDIIINETKIEKEIKNLIIYKKGLFNSEFETENNLISILNPIIKSESIWKSHALYLIAEYFFDKNQKQKAKEFYNKILSYEKSNENVKFEAQKRLSRDLSE
jgi:predicted negative regulator of RcsB-dependent stress response|tara:strand:+ start:574 stop:1218 length:645 start_codon:yes stop_codon:yes gene_type:complete